MLPGCRGVDESQLPRFCLHVKMDGLLQDVRQEAWGGLIPTELSMDSSEITSLQRPLPLYVSPA